MKLPILCLFPLFLLLLFSDTAFSQGKNKLATAHQYLQKGDYASCQKILFPTFLEIRKTLGENNPTYQEALNLLGDLITKTGYYTLAERIAFKDLSLCTHLYGRADVRTANALMRLGDIARAKTDYENAKIHYEQALEIYTNLPNNTLFIAENQVHQGQLLREKGEYTAAEALFRRANMVYQKQALALADIRNLNLNEAYAFLYLALRNYTKATTLLENNNKLLRQFYHVSHPKIAENHYYLADIYLSAGLEKEGKLHLDSAKLQAYQTPELYLIRQKQQADLYRQQNDFSKADTIYRQLLENTSQVTGEHSRLLMDFTAEEAQMYYQMGNYEESLALYERIENLQKEYLSSTHPDYLRTLQGLSAVHWAIGNYGRAYRYFRQSTESLLQQFDKATSFMSEQEKSLFYEESRRFFDRFNAFMLAYYAQNENVSRQMYDYQLQTKALLFSSTLQMREKVMATQDSALIKYYAKWLGGKEQLAKIYKLTNEGVEVAPQLMDSLETNLNDLEKNIQLKIALADVRQGNTKVQISTVKLRKKLAPEEAAVEMIRVQGFNPKKGGRQTDTVYYVALILTAKTAEPTLVLFENGHLMEKSYMKYYKNTLVFRLKDTISYSRFWKPIAESPALKGIKKIFLSVDGVYNQININTLFNPNTQNFLVEEIDIHLLTSTRDIYILKNQQKKHETPNKALLMGYPDYYNSHNLSQSATDSLNTSNSLSEDNRSSNIAELPGTKTEIDGISSLLEANQRESVSLFSADATEVNLKQQAPQHTLLHIATHGFFFAKEQTKPSSLGDERHENPLLRCGILLSGAANAYTKEILQSELQAIFNGKKVEDGILTAYEAMNLDLRNIDLVVLSACETGLGEVKNGEGVYGFQQALQTAGAKALIMSLWKVSDEATMALMVNFYKQWLGSGDKRAAFRAAQAQLRKDFPNPYFWGAFVMIGE